VCLHQQVHYGFRPNGLRLLYLFLILIPSSLAILQMKQPTNLWVTWANLTGQTDFCLSLQSAAEPFRTCLVGLPQYQLEDFHGYVTNVTTCEDKSDTAAQSACIINSLNQTLPWDPQELEIFGSQAVRNGSGNGTRTCVCFGTVCYASEGRRTCVCFGKSLRTRGIGGITTQAILTQLATWGLSRDQYPYENKSWTLVSPINDHSFSLTGSYCGYTANVTRKIRGQNVTGLWPFYAYGVTFQTNSRESLLNNSTAKALPPGIFLICGDRAWQGIPANALGGPCYLGRLTLFMPQQ